MIRASVAPSRPPVVTTALPHAHPSYLRPPSPRRARHWHGAPPCAIRWGKPRASLRSPGRVCRHSRGRPPARRRRNGVPCDAWPRGRHDRRDARVHVGSGAVPPHWPPADGRWRHLVPVARHDTHARLRHGEPRGRRRAGHDVVPRPHPDKRRARRGERSGALGCGRVRHHGRRARPDRRDSVARAGTGKHPRDELHVRFPLRRCRHQCDHQSLRATRCGRHPPRRKRAGR